MWSPIIDEKKSKYDHLHYRWLVAWFFWCHCDGTLHDVDDDVTRASVKIDGLILSVDVIGGIVPQRMGIFIGRRRPLKDTLQYSKIPIGSEIVCWAPLKVIWWQLLKTIWQQSLIITWGPPLRINVATAGNFKLEIEEPLDLPCSSEPFSLLPWSKLGRRINMATHV